MKKVKHYDSIILNLRRLRNIDSRVFEKYVEDKKVPYQHLLMIQYLCKNGPIPISQIKEMYHFSAPAATQLITSLENQGYIVRVQSEIDKRSTLINLSEYGIKTLNEGTKYFDMGVKPFLDFLGEEDSMNLNRILERMIEYFDLKQANNEKK